MSLTVAQIQTAYVVFFGRPADPAGLAFWQSFTGGVAGLYRTFAGTPEYASQFDGLNPDQQVALVYRNLLGREPEMAGLTFWSNAIATGRFTTANLAQAIGESAQGTDATTVANRVAAATSFTTALDTVAERLAYSGTAANAAAREWLATVNHTTQATDLTGAAVDAAVTTATAAGQALINVGQTFGLTTGADNLTGGAGNDTFNGATDVTGAITTNTLSGADIINGGAGTDTLNVTLSGTAAAVLGGADVRGVEILNVRNVGTGAAAVDASQVVGLTALNSDRSTGAVTVTNLATGASAGVIGNGTVVNGAFTAGYVATATAATLNITGGTTGGAVTITGEGLTTATINSTGAANTVGVVDLSATASLTSLTINAATNLTGKIARETTSDFAANSTLTVQGAAANVTLNDPLANAIRTIDASGLTAGGLTATVGTGTQSITGGAGVDTITLNTGVTTANFGAGNDVVTTAAVPATAAGAISGGDGTDTLVVAVAADVGTAAQRAVYTSFETLQNNTTTTIAADGFTGVTSVIMNGINGGFTGLNATQAAAVTNKVDQTAVTLALTTATGTADVLSVTLQHATAANSADLDGATINGFETLNITSSSGNVDEMHANANKVSFAAATDLTAINIGGAFAVNLILDNTAKAVTVANTLTGAAAMRVEGEVKSGSTITTTANGDTIETALAAVAGAQGDFVTYNAGAGNDAITTTVVALNNTVNTQASLKIDGGAGTDTLTFSDTNLTLVDANFQHITNVEQIAHVAAGTTTITTGGFFNANFSAAGARFDLGATTTPSDQARTLDASTFTGNLVVTVNNGATAASTVRAGSGNDAITLVGGTSNVVEGGLGNDTITGGAGADNLSGGVGNDSINGGAGNDTITGGAGNDTITGGAGTNTFVFAAGDSGAPSATVFDIITDFRVGTNNVIDFGGVALLSGNGGTQGVAQASIAGNGIATFNVADDTLAERITAVEAAIAASGTPGAAVAGEFAIWQQGADAFLFVSDATAGVGAGDVLIQLVGVTVGAGGVTVASGDITVIA